MVVLGMGKKCVENIFPADYNIRGSYIPAKKIDIGHCYMIYVSGVQAPKDKNHRVVTDDIGEQTHLVFKAIEKLLTAAGASLDNVIKAVIYITDMSEFDVISNIRSEYFKQSMPVSTMVEVNRMTRDGARIEVEVTALIKK
jgi:2-iminobutanoate/2-iminopropanoate deaminase